MGDLQIADETLQNKLERFEKLLSQIEQNGRANPEEKFYVWRRDLDGKLVSCYLKHNGILFWLKLRSQCKRHCLSTFTRKMYSFSLIIKYHINLMCILDLYL